MTMIEVKTSELSGAALDWAVASSINWVEPFYGVGRIWQDESGDLFMDTPDPDEPEDVTKPEHFNHMETWSPSRFWSQGGPLIQKRRISVIGPGHSLGFWSAHMLGSQVMISCRGLNGLQAACRRLVYEYLGDTVSVPAELVQQ